MDDILIWKQSSWLTNNSIVGADSVFYGIPNDSSQVSSKQFQGLALSAQPDKTYLDGSDDYSNWWHAVGPFILHNGGIPGHNGKLAYSESLYILNHDPLNKCLNAGRSPYAWYNGDSIDISNSKWIDIAGNYMNGVIDNNTDISVQYLNGVPIITGTTSTKISFPVQLDPTQHTVIHLARYIEEGTKGRILQTDTENGLFGHHLNKAGVAYENPTWLTQTINDNFGEAWLISTQQHNLYRGNKIDYTISSGGPFSIAQNLVINQGAIGNEVSDFEFAELIVFNEYLDSAEIECIEDYLKNKYQLPSYNDYLLWTLPSSSFTWSDVHNGALCQLPQILPQIFSQAWCTELVPNDGSWLQVDLLNVHIIESVSTWGRNSIAQQWVTSYELHYSLDGITFTPYSGNPLTGNSDETTEQQNFLTPNIMAKYLRFIPLSYNGWKSMRVEATGRS